MTIIRAGSREIEFPRHVTVPRQELCPQVDVVVLRLCTLTPRAQRRAGAPHVGRPTQDPLLTCQPSHTHTHTHLTQHQDISCDVHRHSSPSNILSLTTSMTRARASAQMCQLGLPWSEVRALAAA